MAAAAPAVAGTGEEMERLDEFLGRVHPNHTEEDEHKAFELLSSDAGVTFHAHLEVPSADGTSSTFEQKDDLHFQLTPGVLEPHLDYHQITAAKHKDQHLPMHTVRGIGDGPKTPPLAAAAKAGADPSLLFTLYADVAINLQAKSRRDIIVFAMAMLCQQRKVGTQVLQFLHQGQLFKIHGQGETAPVTIESGLVKYDCDADQYGLGWLVVYDKPVPMAGIDPVLRFPIHTISEINPRGIHKWLVEQKEKGTIRFDESNSFTVSLPDGVDLHLEAPQIDVHNQWVEALTAYVTGYHEYIAHMDAAAKAKHEASQAAMAAQSDTKFDPLTAEQEAEKLMKVAAAKAAAEPDEAAARRKEDERIYAEAREKASRDAQEAVLKAQRDREAAEAAEKAAAAAREAKEKSDAEKPKPQLVRQASSGDAHSQPYATRAQIHESGVASAAASSSSSSSGNPRAALLAGDDFTAYFDVAQPGQPAQTVSRRLRVFYQPPEQDNDPSMGALYWCEPGTRVMKDDNKLPFGRISDVYLGKQHRTLQSSEAGKETKECCFSLMAGQTWGLHLVADTPATRSTWLAGIRDVFTGSNKSVTEAAPGRRGEAKSDMVSFIQTGSEFTVYFPREVAPQPEKIAKINQGISCWRWTDTRQRFFIYWHSESQAFYHSPDAKIVATADTKIPFPAFIDWENCGGWNTQVGWVGLDTDAYGRNVVLKTSLGDFYLMTDTKEDRDTLIDGLLELRQEEFRRTKHPMTKKELNPHHVKLFYDPPPAGSREEGTLYYCHPHLPNEKNPEHSIAVAAITDVFTGRTNSHDVLLAQMITEQRPPLDRLFTIRSPAAQLILLAPTEIIRTNWLKGLQQAIEKHGGVVKAAPAK